MYGDHHGSQADSEDAQGNAAGAMELCALFGRKFGQGWSARGTRLRHAPIAPYSGDAARMVSSLSRTFECACLIFFEYAPAMLRSASLPFIIPSRFQVI